MSSEAISQLVQRAGPIDSRPTPARVRLHPSRVCTPMAEGMRRERMQWSFESTQTHQIKGCYSSGEEAALSMQRDGFESRAARHQGMGKSGRSRLPRTEEIVGSNPTALTNLPAAPALTLHACRQVARGRRS